MSTANPRRSRARRWLLRLSLGTAAACVVTCGTWSLVRARVGDPAAQLSDHWYAGHRVLDRHGQLLRELPSDTGVRGQPIELAAIGPRLIQSTLLALVDRRRAGLPEARGTALLVHLAHNLGALEAGQISRLHGHGCAS